MKSSLVPKKIVRVPTQWLDQTIGFAASARHQTDSAPDGFCPRRHSSPWPIIFRGSRYEKLLIDYNKKHERFGFAQIADFVRNIGSIAG